MPSEVKISSFFRGQRAGSRGSSASKSKHGSQILDPTKADKNGEMYPLHWPAFDNSDVEKRINGVLGPLSLFAPFPHEDMHEEEPDIGLERPVTPIDKEIKSQPMTFDQLSRYIRRRIAPRDDIPDLSSEDQDLLAGILVGEVAGIWPEIRKQIDDPFLSPEENKELNRRISVHIVTVCEQLFIHYIQKAEVLNRRGIFSGAANMSRLKAQLALDANKFLNILTIRRYIVSDMRVKEDHESLLSEDVMYVQKPKTAVPKMSYRGLIEQSRPKSKTKRVRLKSPEHEARKITETMPTLDTSVLVDLIQELPERQLETPSQDSEIAPSVTPDRQSRSSGSSKEKLSMQKVLLKRSGSVPELQQGETLLEELGIDENVRRDILEEVEMNQLKREIDVRSKVSEKEKKSPRPGTREHIAKDLQELIGKSMEEIKSEEDMPPLLQAITTSAKHDGMKEKLDRKLKELQEKEQRVHEQRSKPLQQPKHPQPSTVKTKLPNNMQVRASDIRVSERICMSSMTLNRFATVYNDLIEEIDPMTVKSLDKNLFLGDEIKEVYKEIMKTIPTQHLELDDDEDVVPAADSVNMTGTMASASLVRKKTDRVINPAFIQENKKPPWDGTDMKQWVKTPNNPPKNFQGEDVFAPLKNLEEVLQLTPNMDKVHEVIRNPSKMSQLLATENMPSFVQDKMSRTYASWLQWWKSTVTSDDYMKYLSTQETDYMAAIFHFYDSGDEDDEEEVGLGTMTYHHQTSLLGTTGPVPLSHKPSSRATHSSKLSELKEKEKKMDELKAQKSEFKEGFWNVNSVLMGGLGKDPIIEEKVTMFQEKILTIKEEEDDASSRAPKSATTERSAKTLRERAAARHSAKMEKSRQDLTQSRASKVTTLTTASKLDTERSSVTEGVQEPPLTPQDRLEKVWSNLEMPDSLKLDMAIKYSCNEFFIKLQEAIERWEKCTELILKRESFLVKLEKFERSASDPNRFFEKGQKRSSVNRLKEAQQRSFLYKRIDHFDQEIKHELQYIKANFKDVITYKGRPYMDKMKWDRIEMLHWLQEERKENAIRYEAMLKELSLKPNQLEPLTALTLPVQKVA